MHRFRPSTRVIRRAATALVVALMLPAASALAASPKQCVSKTEKTALDTRVLQTELMVAALSCGQRDQYNAFVIAHKPHLQANGAALQKLFKRLHGAKGKSALNAFVTRLANEASQHSQEVKDTFCMTARQLFAETMTAPSNDLTVVTSQAWVHQRHGFTPCGNV